MRTRSRSRSRGRPPADSSARRGSLGLRAPPAAAATAAALSSPAREPLFTAAETCLATTGALGST